MRYCWLLGLLSLFFTFSFANPFPINVLVSANIKQNAYAYMPKNDKANRLILSSAQQQHFTQLFLARYYSPWAVQYKPQQTCFTADDRHCVAINSVEQQSIQLAQHNLGYDQHYNAHSVQWLVRIKNNMNLAQTFCQKNCAAITVDNAALRILPTLQPRYLSIKIPGQGYPFDSLQLATLWLGTPVRIVMSSRDKKWYLVDAAGMLGWIETATLARVDNSFEKKWRSLPLSSLTSLKLTTPTKDLYFGSLLPYRKLSTHLMQIFIPYKNKQGKAELRSVHLAQDQIKPWPLLPTPYEFSRVINLFLGMTYGWGGLYDDSDCSGALKRLYANFGIWLPRHSGAQGALAGKMSHLPISRYSVMQRKQIFLGKAGNKFIRLVPYLTLITFQESETGPIDHVALYIGSPDKKHIIIFQSVWGFHIVKQKDGVGRLIVGKAALTQMNLGENINLQDRSLQVQTLWQVPGLNYTVISSDAN